MNKPSTLPQPLERAKVITALAHLRLEWEEAADDEPLLTLHGSVGLLLDDVMDALGLTELEKGEVRGQWHKGVGSISL